MEILKWHYHDVVHVRTWLVSFIGKQWNCHFVASYRRDRVTDKRYLYPIRDSHSSLKYRKKGHLVQLVRESDLFFRVKRQIKTVLTNVVVEHVKAAWVMQKQGNGKSVVHKQAWICWCANIVIEIFLILYTSPYHIYKTVGVNLTEYARAKRTW